MQKQTSEKISVVFSSEFSEICKNTFFAEHHRTTASDYSSINSSGGELANETLNYDTKTKYLSAYVPIWARSVSY